MTAIKPVELEINQDWAVVIKAYQQVNDLWNQDRLGNQTYDSAYETMFFNLGSLGSLQSLDNLCVANKSASFLHGNIFEKSLTWLPWLIQDFQPAGLESVCLFASNKNILPHRDFEPNNQAQGHICKIHYVLNDSDAEIFVAADKFKCVGDTAWLMNVEQLHGMTTPDQWVYTFQMSFHKPFDEVSAWLDSKSKFVY